MAPFSPSASPSQRQKAVHALIAELNQDRAPILLGPYRSELGFEVSYWLPFLRALAAKVKDFSSRAAVVTRGGLAPLYADVASHGYDLYALRDVTDVRRENLYDATVRQKGQTIKQLVPTEWDDAVLEDAAHALGIHGLYHVVHPAWMYWALAPYWEEKAGLGYLTTLADFAPLPKLPKPQGLPEHYVAVKFYGRATFTHPHPDVSAFVQRTVATIAAHRPVVLLNSGSQHDDHVDIALAGPNIATLDAANVPPEQNLAQQAAVISHARAFIGTYGGVAQLALRLGVPSVSFWADWGGTALAHLHLSSWLSKVQGVPFVAGSIAETVYWRQVTMPPERQAA